MRKLLIRALCLCAVAATPLSTAVAVTVTLDFETGAPCLFNQTAPLTNLGDVTFTGVDGAGGSILNQCSTFGQDAFSGVDFYAFNTGAGTGSMVDITFGGNISEFSIWASQGFSSNSFIAQAFSAGNALLDTFMFSPTDNAWGLMSLAASNISRVRLAFEGGCCAIYDDLTYTTTVPEPGTLALFGLGLVGMGLTRRRKKA